MITILSTDDFNLFKKETLSRLESIERLLSSNKNESNWLTVEEVKAKYKIKSTTTVDKLLKTAKKRIGRRTLYNKEAIEKLIR